MVVARTTRLTDGRPQPLHVRAPYVATQLQVAMEYLVQLGVSEASVVLPAMRDAVALIREVSETR